jgi:DNA-binding transcriptional MerR regulator
MSHIEQPASVPAHPQEGAVKISELSRVSGVPVATIKFYLREGLVPPGTLTARNQADYSESHLRRLRLIRTLLEIGGLRVAAIRTILNAVADDSVPLGALLGVTHQALGLPPDPKPLPDDLARARTEVDRFVADHGWRVDPGDPSRRALADALVTLWRFGRDADVEVFAPYAELADQLADHELDQLSNDAPRSDLVEQVVVGTVVFETALLALRRMAQAHHSANRFGPARQTRRARRADHTASA